MFLEKIEIQGFKSFANKTVLEFPKVSNHDSKARSVTAIVGPNGSGKSNISDAIRWVLGEQSPKTLRGKKSDDVIFAGSGSKARLGFAEVSLYLNNEDKSAPIDYTQIVITRRIFRDGEGEYLINKNKVRLYDILMLLAKANFGQKSYSIVGQGMVDHIINISPWERKDFFDEATGVKQYQIKRDQSVNKLNRSKENLEQTNQILAELEPRLRLLTRQIKKLEKRKEVEKDLKNLQGKYYAHIWDKLKNEKQKFDENFSIKQSLKDDLEARLNDIQTQLATLAKEESRKEAFNELQKKYNKLTAQKNDLLKDLSVLKGKMSLEYTKVGKQNLSWLEDKKEELAGRINEIKESLNNLTSKTKAKQDYLTANSEKLEEAINELRVLQNNQQQAYQDLETLKNGSKQAGNHYAVKQVLSLVDKIPGIYGTVGQLGKVEEMYEGALSASVGARMNAIVVKDDQTAVQCIEFLKENKAGTATFLPLNKIKAYKIKDSSRQLLAKNGAIGFAVELLGFEPKFKKVFEHLLGSTIIVDNAQNAAQVGIGQERLVTLDGDVFEKTGVMRGGFHKKIFLSWFALGKSADSSGYEEKVKEIELNKVKLENLHQQKEKLTMQVNELKVELQVNETKQKGLENDLESLKKEREKISSEILENQISPKDEKNYLKQLQTKRAQLENNLEQIDDQLLANKKKIDDFNTQEEKKKVQVFALQEEMQNYQIKLNEVNNEYNDIRISLAKLETKKEDLEKEVTQELGAVKLRELKSVEAINSDQLWFEISKLKKSLELIGGIDPEVVDEHKEVSERYEFLSTQVNDLEQAIKDLSKIIDELDKVIEKQFGAAFKKINSAFEHYFKKIFEGGKAKLTLLQKEDPKTRQQKLQDEQGNLIVDEEQELISEKPGFTQTGVDIYVSPPNKKLQTISALSGGERTMTSLALLCAIIDNNPSPFVVMDEVDAALDEANSERFAKIIEELSYKTQFVLITHNRVIMHVADVLYGVAMGDDGISKTLSLDLKEAEKIGEEES